MINKKEVELLEQILSLSQEYHSLKAQTMPERYNPHSHDIIMRTAEEELIIQKICKLLGVNYSYYLHR